MGRKTGLELTEQREKGQEKSQDVVVLSRQRVFEHRVVLRALVSQPAGACGSQPVPEQELGLCLRFRTVTLRRWQRPSSPQHRGGRRGRFGGTEQEWGRADGVKEPTSGAEFCQAKGEVVEMQA